jgi:hypothetical protein
VNINKWTSPFWNNVGKKKFPLVTITDVTDEHFTPGWDKWRRYPEEGRDSCLSDGYCGFEHFSAPQGSTDCFEQAPKEMHSFLAMMGRKYLVTFVDQNFFRVTADVELSVTKMRPDEVVVFQFTHRPPLYPRLPLRASVTQGSVGLWGELEPRLGAWSPEPKMPVYHASLEDHGGNPVNDPCASGVFRTSEFRDSCFSGSFEVSCASFACSRRDPSLFYLTRMPLSNYFFSKFRPLLF